MGQLKEKIERGIHGAKELILLLPLRDPARIYKALFTHDMETLLFAMAISPDADKKKEISRYLLELRKIKPVLRGVDLKRMGLAPGPFYSKVLDTLLEERLRGNLVTKEDEERFVRRRYVSPCKDSTPRQTG